MIFKHTVCKDCVKKGTAECPIAYVECGEVLGNYYEVDPNTFYCSEAKDEGKLRSRDGSTLIHRR